MSATAGFFLGVSAARSPIFGSAIVPAPPPPPPAPPNLSTQAFRMAFLRPIWEAMRNEDQTTYATVANTGTVRYCDFTIGGTGGAGTFASPYRSPADIPGGAKTNWTWLFKGGAVHSYDWDGNDLGQVLGSYDPATGARVFAENLVAELRPTAGGSSGQAVVRHQPTAAGTFTISGLKLANPARVGTNRKQPLNVFGLRTGSTCTLEYVYVGVFPSDPSTPGFNTMLSVHGTGDYNLNMAHCKSRDLPQGGDQIYIQRLGQGGTVNVRYCDVVNPLYEQQIISVVQNNPLRVQVASTAAFSTGETCAIDQLNGTVTPGISGAITVISSTVVEFNGLNGTSQAANIPGRWLTRDAGPDTMQVFRGPTVTANVTAVTTGATTQVTLSSVASLHVGQTVTFASVGGVTGINGQAPAAITNIAGSVITVALATSGTYTSGGTMSRTAGVGTINVTNCWFEQLQNAKAAILVANNTIPTSGEAVTVRGGFLWGPDPSTTVQLEGNFAIPVNIEGSGAVREGIYADGFSGGYGVQANGVVRGCVRVLQRTSNVGVISAAIDTQGTVAGILVENNTVIGIGNLTGWQGCSFSSGTTATVRNNAFVNVPTGINDPSANVTPTNNVFFNVTNPYTGGGSLHGSDRNGTDPLLDNVGRPAGASIVKTGAAAIDTTYTDPLNTAVALISSPWVGAMQTGQ